MELARRSILVDTAPQEAVLPQGDRRWDLATAYDQWIETVGIPIHRGYYIPDGRTVELGWWEERKCHAAFLQLAGMEGVAEIRASEIAPGATTAPVKLGFDEVVYVLDGRGLTTITDPATGRTHTFEWGKHAMFMLPRNCTHQISNVSGTERVRLLHNNYLPLAMSTVGEPGYFFNNPYTGSGLALDDTDLYSEAKAVRQGLDEGGVTAGVWWYGNFFPNMRTTENLAEFKLRGAGGSVIWIRFPQSPLTCHMSVFPAQTYKKAHRHGAGFAIVIPSGEGYSVMWQEGKEQVVVPWQEGTIFVPPARWFHQHFNLGEIPARYLAFHPPWFLSGFSEKVEDVERDQIEYTKEAPSVRQRFEGELSKRGMTSLIPEDAYRDPKYTWTQAATA